jgi:fructose-1,6-bisphosphatase/inositol monophosphatase family enzyme
VVAGDGRAAARGESELGGRGGGVRVRRGRYAPLVTCPRLGSAASLGIVNYDIDLPASGNTAIDVAWRCAREGGRLALERFGGVQAIDIKGHRNIVTETDVAVELKIKAILASEYPSHKILSEETAADTDVSRGWTWVIDPIDGTKNYAMGIPFWCVNIALCRDGEPIVALTYDAVHDEGYWAVAGQGAYCGQQRITASSQPDVFSSVIGLDLGYDDALGMQQLDLIRRIFPDVQGFRLTGSAALGLAYAACGRIDLYAHLNCSPWDVAAGLLLVREAGGVATDRDGAPMRITSRAFAAGGRLVHADFMKRYASDAAVAGPTEGEG